MLKLKKPVLMVLFFLPILAIALSGCNKKDNGSQAGQLSGKIYDAATKELIIIEPVTLTLAGKAITVTNGKYLFTGLTPGDKTLTVLADGSYEYSASVRIVADKTTTKDVYLEQIGVVGQLSGKIYDDATKELITEDVFLTLTGETSKTVSDGNFAFADVRAGTKTLTVKADGYQSDASSVEIAADQTTTKDIYLKAAAASSFSIPEVLIPSAASFPTGAKDSGTNAVSYSYYMAKYEVTYQLWKEVYNWATDAARGASQYYFQNQGQMGQDPASPSVNDQHPVTKVNWRDAMVWCNALTEYYNANNDESLALECVYTYNGQIVRDSRDTNANACDNVTDDKTDGYRLPASNEWELAARYQDGISWTPWHHVSGDHSGPCYSSTGETLSTVFGEYAWYRYSSSFTHAVGVKLPNALGIYDMSGNVWEWCFDGLTLNGVNKRIKRGGGWYSVPSDLRLYHNSKYYDPAELKTHPEIDYWDQGFRPVRTW